MKPSMSWLAIALVAAHVLAVLIAGWIHRENLVVSMITGHKRARFGGGRR